MAIPILIDTDPGIDDALALLLAFASPEVSVEAITTVAGNVSVERCTTNVFRILEMVKPSRLPVVAQGSERPLFRPLVSAGYVHGEDGLGNLEQFTNEDRTSRYPPVQAEAVAMGGVELILEVADRLAGELVVVALGPLTNLALALERDPRRLAAIKRLVVMGGAVVCPGNVTPVAEFNFYVDPEAAQRVLAAGLPVELIPLDVTQQVALSRPGLDARLSRRPGAMSQFIGDFTRVAFEFGERAGEGGLTLHDPLAMGVALDPTLVSFAALHVQVECDGTLTRGMAVADRRPRGREITPNCQVALGVDASRFLSFFLDRLCPPSS